VGNRIAEVRSGGNTTYSSDATNQYTSVSSVNAVVYSDRGDLTQFGDWTYSYDAQGNLIRASNSQTTAQYWRDVSGHRAVKDFNGTKTLFFNIGNTQLESYDVTNATASSTIYEPGIDRPLAEVGSGGSATFYHQDWLGNVVLLTNNAGAKVESYTYDVWGKPSGFDASGSLISAFSSRFLYTAREYDAETGLYHYRTRAYSPAIGRFLQTDSIDFDGGDVNLFRYVSNCPLQGKDPFGLDNKNLFKNGSNAARITDARGKGRGEYTVGGHGNPKSIHDENNNDFISPKELADMIRDDSDYDPCKPVRLNSCRTGAGDDSFAQDLADELNNDVLAPTGEPTMTGAVNPFGPGAIAGPIVGGGYQKFSPRK
jgi:RHS repeat-associated protein